MANAIPDSINPADFEAKLATCSEPLRALVSYLRTSAQHAGTAATERRFRHAAPNSGWGITFYANASPFCEIHPKPQEGHAWVRLPGADPDAVEAAGFERSKQEGWFKIREMGDAVRLVPWVLQSHDVRARTEA